ncbi:hypothetical protein L1987_13684 [Smallanthus sonchifolius]|uniref:Uncharacterized protein n=1 Tax=Smallanthus sonchifolius TaxID=185202 RepID=A0ACB9JHK5_9ASTR|nr:hypothetical protein L1987_13684 [Smallanthus sonchifolius]
MSVPEPRSRPSMAPSAYPPPPLPYKTLTQPSFHHTSNSQTSFFVNSLSPLPSPHFCFCSTGFESANTRAHTHNQSIEGHIVLAVI